MADPKKRISEFPEANVVTGGDTLIGNQSTETKRFTVEKIKDYVEANIPQPPTLSDANPQKIGQEGSGSSLDVSRSDHRHAMEYAYIWDEKPSGTNGGTFTAGDWRTRDLNQYTSNINGFVLDANTGEFTLPAGVYKINVSAPVYGVNNHKSVLVNKTTASFVAYGTSEANVVSASSATARSRISCIITIPSTQTFRVDHRCLTTSVTYGFGIASAFGVPEIYTQVEIIKIG